MFYQFIQSDPKKTYPFFNTLSLRFINEVRTKKNKGSPTKSPKKVRTSVQNIPDLNLRSSALSVGSNDSRERSQGQIDEDDVEFFKETFIIRPYFITKEDYDLLVEKMDLEDFLACNFSSKYCLLTTRKLKY